MVPREVTIAVVEAELPPLNGYANRHGWRIDWRPEALVLIADGEHPADGSPVRLHACVAGYRAIPPAWRFICHDSDSPETPRTPQAGALPGGISSIFHGSGVICAPFNRLAYKEHAGPHADWAAPTNWLKVRGTVSARNLSEMLAQIRLHLKYSPGWQT